MALIFFQKWAKVAVKIQSTFLFLLMGCLVDALVLLILTITTIPALAAVVQQLTFQHLNLFGENFLKVLMAGELVI